MTPLPLRRLPPLLAITTLTLLAAPRAARADDRDSEPREDLVTVAVHVPDGFTFSLGTHERRRGFRRIARCDGSCVVRAPRGDLEVRLYDADGALDGTRRFHLDAPSELVVGAASPRLSGLGLFAGFGGSAALLLGSGPCFLSQMGESSDARKSAQVGCGAMLVGLIATPIGFVLYGQTHAPTVDVGPLATTRVRAAFAPSRGGGMVSVGVEY